MKKLSFGFIVSLGCEITNKNDRNRKYKKVFEQDAKNLEGMRSVCRWHHRLGNVVQSDTYSGGFIREKEVMVV